MMKFSEKKVFAPSLLGPNKKGMELKKVYCEDADKQWRPPLKAGLEPPHSKVVNFVKTEIVIH